MACVTITLILFTAYLAYRVYHQGEKRFLDPPKQGAASQAKEFIVEEQRVQERAPSGSDSKNKRPARADEEIADHGEIQLELDDGNAKPDVANKQPK